MAKRLLALLCALLLVAGSLGRALQDLDAAESHVVCPEHGELLHTSAGVVGAVDEVVLPTDLAHGDTCTLASLGTTPVGPTLQLATLHHPLGTRLGHDGVAAAAVVARVPPLRDAPKASPPTV